MLVKQIMTKKVVTVKTTDNLETVLGKFSKYKITGVPVVDKNNKLKGIVTEADVLKTIDICLPKVRFDNQSSFSLILEFVKKPSIELLREGKHCKKIRVSEFMNTGVITVGPNEDATRAAQLMNKFDVNRLIVIENDKVVGIIARADIVRMLAK
ncbi:MAG: CBS domain-containing protein [Candidatus Aenigmarchaeota archaeon]|nr:CBS domain-containing protein [Candidatus Aenigmarchaeota archaeon]